MASFPPPLCTQSHPMLFSLRTLLSVSLSLAVFLSVSVFPCVLPRPGSEGAPDVLMLVMPSLIAGLICQISVSLSIWPPSLPRSYLLPPICLSLPFPGP